MKRYISVVFVALAVILASQSAFAGNQIKPGNPKYKDGGNDIPQKHSVGGTTLSQMDNWKPFLPKDTIYSENDHVGDSCDKDGNYIKENTVYRCKLVQSKSTGLHYRIRRSQEEGDRIFVMKKGKPNLFVQFEGGGSVVSGSHVVLYTSPDAIKFAENNGYVLDKRNNTMVAKGSLKDNAEASEPTPTDNPAPTQTTNVVDCASKTALLEKMKCIADNAAAQNK